MVISTEQLKKNIENTVGFIKSQTTLKPRVGIILGTGLGKLVDEIAIEKIIDYSYIPHFPLSTVEFHEGKLILGEIGNTPVLAMQGRFHYYEGYTMQEITYPVRVMKQLGVDVLIISNACGSVNPHLGTSEIMIMEDHINLLGDNPLRGINDNSFGPRFTDMSEPYSMRLIQLTERIALENKIKVQRGVYAAMLGPSLETRAEYKFLKIIGADVVGMSSVPENIVARQMGMEVLGMSIVTDLCNPETLKPINLDEILHNAAIAEPKLSLLIKNIVQEL